MTHRLVFLFALFTCFHTHGQPLVKMDIHHVPAPVSIGGKPVIYYELWLTSVATAPLTLQKLDVIDVVDSAVLATFTADELKKRYSTPAGPAKATAVHPGDAGLLYLEVTLPSPQVHPRLLHRLTITDVTHKTATMRGGVLTRSDQTPPVLGQPLRGGPWAAIYEPMWERGHRRVLYTVNDTICLPGRYAIDFMLLNSQAKLNHHNTDSVINWYGYGVDVLAVADGTVVATRHDFPESPTLSAHPRHPPEKAAGNYLALNIGGGRYVFYEHLKPGSITVKTGQRVKKGEHIASLGFTGQTTGPHLHLHVADHNSILGAEGLPFTFEKFTMLGAYPGAEGLGEKPWVPSHIKQPPVTQERPTPNAVINFP